MLKGPFIIILIVAVLTCHGQDREDSASVAKNTFYFELFGSGFPGTFNYDRLLIIKGNRKVAGRIGFMYLFFLGDVTVRNPLVSCPVEASYLISNGGSHHLELSLGVTYIYGLNTAGNWSTSTLYFTPSIGYRRQKPTGGMFYKIRFMIYKGIAEFSSPPDEFAEQTAKDSKIFFPFAGASIGYTIRSKK